MAPEFNSAPRWDRLCVRLYFENNSYSIFVVIFLWLFWYHLLCSLSRKIRFIPVYQSSFLSFPDILTIWSGQTPPTGLFNVQSAGDRPEKAALLVAKPLLPARIAPINDEP